MSELKPLLFGALCALSAVPCFLFVRLNRVEGFGSSPPPRDHWWSGHSGLSRRYRNLLAFFPLLVGLYIFLHEGWFAEVEVTTQALLGLTLAQGLYWALILAFPPEQREDKTELSARATARARRRSSKPPLWLSLGLGLTILGTLLLAPGMISAEWSGRLGALLLWPPQMLLGFLCISSMIRTELDERARLGFLAAFLLPSAASFALALL